MAKFQTLHKYLYIILALVAGHVSLLAHARKTHIKALNQHYYSPTTNTVANDPQLHLPSLKTNVESPHYEKASKLEDSGAGSTNAFRPTTPGGSPGVGHGIITSEDHNNMKSSMVVVQTGEDTKSEGPGHSPGVGHASYLNKIGQGN
ncbi:unnamed protein product [Sphenostylis stenocarpa]|uniref:Uncharacterized protein n=1 Tax=Sphenostylis stenocarpa TaxID=92480 RepID=A0AA86VGT2_9FABA|nr:unnamed protein product [Sphenostylis stenocarpa]